MEWEAAGAEENGQMSERKRKSTEDSEQEVFFRRGLQPKWFSYCLSLVDVPRVFPWAKFAWYFLQPNFGILWGEFVVFLKCDKYCDCGVRDPEGNLTEEYATISYLFQVNTEECLSQELFYEYS